MKVFMRCRNGRWFSEKNGKWRHRLKLCNQDQAPEKDNNRMRKDAYLQANPMTFACLIELRRGRKGKSLRSCSTKYEQSRWIIHSPGSDFSPAMLFLFWFKVNGTIVAWHVTDAVAFALNIMLEAKRYTKYDMRMRVGRTRLRHQD